MTFHNDVNGDVFVAMAGMTQFSGDGDIARITLAKNRPYIPSLRGSVSIDDVMFNEGTPEAVIEGSEAGPKKIEMALGPASPNPFVEGTRLSFSIPTSAAVSISVYNVNGQLVKTLVNGVVPAGQQTVAWDGTDVAGNKVARGVYFCRMHTEGFSANQKLVMLK
jgi:hypothetical protein